MSLLVGDEHKGIVLYSGPDGVKDHQTRVKDPQWVGHGTASPESTSNLNYLCRAPKDNPPPEPKSARVGEVGWGVPRLTDYSNLKSGHQIQLKTFRNRVEERHTHRFQEPYYPSPQFDPTSYPTKSSPTTSESCTETHTEQVLSAVPPTQSGATSSTNSMNESTRRSKDKELS
ncbi:protein SPMIP2-like [Dysidea avara]|uniref:protein SPMIP2-like n=1 Tax=Dysidea avara TaxID=196820 RepID=UPI003326AB2B